MSAPNIVNVATITGKSSLLAVPITAVAFITNAADSGVVLKVNTLYVSNISASAVTLTADVYRGTTAYRFAYQIVVPAGVTLDALSKPLYLEEGMTLRLTAGTVSALEAVGSYEIIA